MKLVILFLLHTTSFMSIAQDLYSFVKDGRHGFMNKNGDVAIAPQFEAALQFSEGLATVYLDSLPRVIDQKGNTKFTTVFNSIYPFIDSYAIVIQDEKYGIIDTTGKVILPAHYDWISFQGEGKIGLKENNLWSFFSLETKQLLNDQKYAEIGVFSENRAMVQSQMTQKCGFIDELGDLVIPFTLERVYQPFRNGFAAVIDEKKRSLYINKNGLNQFDTYYSNVDRFSEGRAFVKEKYNEPGYFIDTLGNRTSSRTYDDVWWYSEGFCGVRTDSSFSIIDKTETSVFTSKTIELRFYVDGFGAFCDHSGDKLTWGIMNANQEIISERRFTLLVNKTNDLFWEFYFGDPAKWYGSGKRGYINLKGKIIWEEK